MNTDSAEKKVNIVFLKELLNMIENGANGFELAYKIEEFQLIRDLMYDGIIFYNTFIEIGDLKVKDAPDKKKKDYFSFRTIEDTEKNIFMKWAKNLIETEEKPNILKEEYTKYIDSKKKWQLDEIICEKCGAIIDKKNQKICEECGNLLK